MHEWVDLYVFIGIGGPGALVGAVIVGLIGLATSDTKEERLDRFKVGAIIGAILGIFGAFAGVVTFLTS